MSIPDTANQAYQAAKRAAEVRYAQDLAAVVHLRGGNEVRERARQTANDRLTAAYQDAALIALYHGNPIVDAAEAALRAFGTDLTRAEATRLLRSWKHTPELSVRERQAVLARFPIGDDTEHGNSGLGGAL